MTDFWEALVEGTLQEEYYAEKALRCVLREMDRYAFEYLPYPEFLRLHARVQQVLCCMDEMDAGAGPEAEEDENAAGNNVVLS